MRLNLFRFLSSTVRVTCVRATFSLLALCIAIAGPALLLAFQVFDDHDDDDNNDFGYDDDDHDGDDPCTLCCHCWACPSSCLSGGWWWWNGEKHDELSHNLLLSYRYLHRSRKTLPSPLNFGLGSRYPPQSLHHTIPCNAIPCNTIPQRYLLSHDYNYCWGIFHQHHYHYHHLCSH